MTFNLDSAVGIEISKRRLVLSSVVRGLRGLRVGPNLVLEDFQELDRAELQSRIHDFIGSNGLTTENVVVGLSRDRVAIKQVDLPLEVEENLDQVVQFQVNKLEPSEDVKVCFDYLVLDRDEKSKSITLQIILASREAVDEVIALLGDLGLQPSSMRLSSIGLHQLLRFHKDGISEHPSIILRCEEEAIEAILIGGPGKHFSCHQPVSSQENRLELLSSALDNLLSQVDLDGSEQVQEIYLTGSGADEALEPVRERFGSAQLLSDGVSLKFEGAARSSLAVTGCSVGLAASSLTRSPFSKMNLIPPEMRRSRTQISYVPTVVLAVLLLFLLGLSTSREYLQQTQLLAGISAQRDGLRPRVAWVIETREEADQLAELAVEMSTMLSGRQRALSVLKELTELIPDDAYLQSVRIQMNKVTMTGFSDTAASLIPILQEANCLTNVESKYITRDRRSGKDKFSFEASIEECAPLGQVRN